MSQKEHVHTKKSQNINNTTYEQESSEYHYRTIPYISPHIYKEPTLTDQGDGRFAPQSRCLLWRAT